MFLIDIVRQTGVGLSLKKNKKFQKKLPGTGFTHAKGLQLPPQPQGRHMKYYLILLNCLFSFLVNFNQDQ